MNRKYYFCIYYSEDIEEEIWFFFLWLSGQPRLLFFFNSSLEFRVKIYNKEYSNNYVGAFKASCFFEAKNIGF